MNFEILHEFPSPEIERAWREFLTRVEIASHYDSPEFFLDPLRRGDRPFAVLALDDNRVRGVLTGFHLGIETLSGLLSRPQICVETAGDTATIETLAKGFLAEGNRSELLTI